MMQKKMMKLHHVFYKVDKEFKDKIQNHDQTIWLFSNNNDVKKKNVDKLVKISKINKLPVARLNCWYDTNKIKVVRTGMPIRCILIQNVTRTKQTYVLEHELR